MNNQLCLKSLYEPCKCSLHTHLSKDIPIVDAHCHLDDFLNKDSFFKSLSTSTVRKVYTISNKHKYQNWNKIFNISCQNLYIYESFGIHPKYLPEHNLNEKLVQLENIFNYEKNPISGRPIVGVGEVGLDETSKSQLFDQKLVLERQIMIARRTGLPLILHCRGLSLFRTLFDSISSTLPHNHPIQWHCIKSDSDLSVIDQFISTFPNSVISLNGSITSVKDIDQDKIFKKWVRNHPNLLNHLVLETDCPWLRPQSLPVQEYNPCTGIFTTSKWLENVLRIHGKNASKIIEISNDNTMKIFRL
jgi:Tat protein secretion system quality control protein TatD with DNase activity